LWLPYTFHWGTHKNMRQALTDLDRILRGDASHLDALGSGTLATSARRLSGVIVLLAMFYGLCMGSYAVVNGQINGWMQMIASMAKVPALFFLTLAVTLPSLYVFNALVGSRLSALSFMRLLVAAMGVMLALLASFGTIVAFFSFTTTSLPFMVLLNVAVFGIAGVLGLTFLLRTLQRLTAVRDEPLNFEAATPEPTPAVAAEPMPTFESDVPDAPEAEPLLQRQYEPIAPSKVERYVTGQLRPTIATHKVPGALAPLPDRVLTSDVKTVFRLWIVLFALVGSQMSWILRPFIGSGKEFVLFRPRGSNFFEALWKNIASFF
jgi:hypothetical protein